MEEDHVPRGVLAHLSNRNEVSEAVIDTQGSEMSKSCRHTDGRSSGGETGEGYVDLLKSVYQDQQALNYAQKEKIAARVLRGDYNVSQAYEPMSKNNGYNPYQHEAHATAILRRHQLKHRIFELTSQPASFHKADPNMRKAMTHNYNKELGQGPRHYVSRGQHVPTVPLYVPMRKEKPKADFPSKSDIVAHQVSLDADKVKHFRKNMSDQRTEYKLRKKREIEIRKKMASFKEKLFKRLKEKNDPQVTSIMRSLDDNVIFNFIESFKGCTMSVDAILLHIGVNVTPSTSATDTNKLEEVRPTSAKKASTSNFPLHPREYKVKGAGFRQNKHHKDGERGHEHTDHSRPYSPSVLSVHAMREQMATEKLLPSMQAEKVITDEELENLGHHWTSCDQLFPSQQPLGKVDVATRRPPRSLKTQHDANMTKPHSEVPGNAQSLPSLSSTNYGGMYVISSYKDSIC